MTSFHSFVCNAVTGYCSGALRVRNISYLIPFVEVQGSDAEHDQCQSVLAVI
jgi:hypothetical protein